MLKLLLTGIHVCCLFLSIQVFSQIDLSYYLPEKVEYDERIPTPQSILGYEVGEWHVSHDKLVQYMYALAASSDKVTIEEYAHSYENRPLVLLTITSEKNQENISDIQKEHVALTTKNGKSKNIKDMPLVVWLGNAVHGNEPSGGNASMLMAYHLVAAKDDYTKKLLENTVILLDPCFNPDGFNRFAHWVNAHKSKNLNPDPQNREYHEVWPGGRTNHYWFDLNRDWLLVQHPESQGRINKFHEWKPNVLTDAHEMGKDNTYFFQPGIPSRNNPLTPENTFTLTKELSEYHAAALDSIGSLYYSEESFDDFYVGKGSTYPDLNGCVGVLFEQASSRGHLQETTNGLLSFPFTIRNQLNTSFSTLKGAFELRESLLKHQQNFYGSVDKEQKKDKVKGYIFGDNHDISKTKALAELLAYHDIEAKPIDKNYKGENQEYQKDKAYTVSCNQQQYRLIRSIFETRTSFKDSLFYDVSSWTLPLAFNIPYEPLTKINEMDNQKEKKAKDKTRIWKENNKAYAYLIKNEEYYLPLLLNELLTEEVMIKIATKPFNYKKGKELKIFEAGTMMIPMGGQKDKKEVIEEILKNHFVNYNGNIEVIESGLTQEGIDLGSPSFEKLRLPKIALVVGDGVNAYEAGEVWHLLDQRYNMWVTLLEKKDVKDADLSRYNTLILVAGNYGGIPSTKIKNWVQKGGILITQKSATKWVAGTDFCRITAKISKEEKKQKRFPYEELDRKHGAQVIGGAIFEGKADLSHPLLYGIYDSKVPLFRNDTYFFNPTKNAYATPIIYTDEPLISGYISKQNLAKLKGSAALMVSGQGKGRIIAFADNPNFRAFWYGTNKLFMNAIFFGHVIDKKALE